MVMGSEDFADMSLAAPSAYAFLSGKGDFAVHHPAYTFDDSILPKGAALLAHVAETRLAAG
jgi:hippurate hydrolase